MVSPCQCVCACQTFINTKIVWGTDAVARNGTTYLMFCSKIRKLVRVLSLTVKVVGHASIIRCVAIRGASASSKQRARFVTVALFRPSLAGMVHVLRFRLVKEGTSPPRTWWPRGRRVVESCQLLIYAADVPLLRHVDGSWDNSWTSTVLLATLTSLLINLFKTCTGLPAGGRRGGRGPLRHSALTWRHQPTLSMHFGGDWL